MIKIYREKKGYIADLKTKNFKNNLYYIVNSVEIDNSGLLVSGCLYTNT